MDTSFLSRAWRLATNRRSVAPWHSASARKFSPVATAQAAPAPKAYVALFNDNSVAVLNTRTNQALSKIPVPTGPHGIVITH